MRSLGVFIFQDTSDLVEISFQKLRISKLIFWSKSIHYFLRGNVGAGNTNPENMARLLKPGNDERAARERVRMWQSVQKLLIWIAIESRGLIG